MLKPSTDSVIFKKRVFDYCIVDEASQIPLPTCLSPLRFAHKFILVGDHKQLPPLVRSRLARKKGYDVSLFKLLADAHEEDVAHLRLQYRMNEEIMSLSNRLVYEGRLKCGNREVAERKLRIAEKGLDKVEEEWLRVCADPE
jgi:DNA replication ATP-dependent helicase Dna2